MDKITDKYKNYIGSEREHNDILNAVSWVNKTVCHPYYNVPKSVKIKNKKRGRLKHK